MRIYTSEPYLVDNTGLAYVKIILSQADSQDPAIVGRPWRLTFDKFTSTGFYNPAMWVSVFSGFSAGLNYDTFENNFPSPPLSDWDPNPAFSENDIPGTGSPAIERLGITVAMSPSNSFVTLDYDFTIHVDVGGGTWVPLFDLLSETLTVLGTDDSFPDDTTGTDLITSGLIVVEGGGVIETCFWTDIVGATEVGCDGPAPGEGFLPASLAADSNSSGTFAMSIAPQTGCSGELSIATEDEVLLTSITVYDVPDDTLPCDTTNLHSYWSATETATHVLDGDLALPLDMPEISEQRMVFLAYPSTDLSGASGALVAVAEITINGDAYEVAVQYIPPS